MHSPWPPPKQRLAPDHPTEGSGVMPPLPAPGHAGQSWLLRRDLLFRRGRFLY